MNIKELRALPAPTLLKRVKRILETSKSEQGFGDFGKIDGPRCAVGEIGFRLKIKPRYFWKLDDVLRTHFIVADHSSILSANDHRRMSFKQIAESVRLR